MLTKICGVTTPDDARMVAEAGADWIGINFHPASKRHVPPDHAAGLVAAIGDRAVAVGLFVDQGSDEVAAVADRAGLRVVQLHGDEPAETVRDLRRGGYRVVRAFRLADRSAIDRMTAWLLRAEPLGGVPDAVLVDAHVPGLAGGTGARIATEVLGMLADRLREVPFLASHERPDRPGTATPRVILAGGLTPENVAEAAAQVRPWMVDVASGVESSPGRKDPARVVAFLAAAHSVPPTGP